MHSFSNLDPTTREFEYRQISYNSPINNNTISPSKHSSRKGSSHSAVTKCGRCDATLQCWKAFEWTKCLHVFCVDCVMDTVNENLCLLNEVPTCWHPDCDQELDPRHFCSIPKSLWTLQPRYNGNRLNMDNLSKDIRDELLFTGYIRSTLFIPTDILELILNFFKLTYYSQSPCTQCEGYGYKTGRRCDACRGHGHGTEVVFNGKERKTYRCSRGMVRAVVKDGYSKRTVVCTRCDGEGYLRKRCNDCNGMKANMILDFKMLRRKQRLCRKCNAYFPVDMIISWSECHHHICIDCVLAHFREEHKKTEESKGAIPRCVVADCKEELSLHTLQEIQLLAKEKETGFDELLETVPGGVPYRSTKELLQVQSDRDIRKRILELLHHKHGTGFYCAHCHGWHFNEEGIAWSGCGHRFGRDCAQEILDGVIAAEHRDVRAAHCERIPVCEAIVGTLENTLPLQPKYCCSRLQVKEAMQLSATPYQLDVLQRLWGPHHVQWH